MVTLQGAGGTASKVGRRVTQQGAGAKVAEAWGGSELLRRGRAVAPSRPCRGEAERPSNAAAGVSAAPPLSAEVHRGPGTLKVRVASRTGWASCGGKADWAEGSSSTGLSCKPWPVCMGAGRSADAAMAPGGGAPWPNSACAAMDTSRKPRWQAQEAGQGPACGEAVTGRSRALLPGWLGGRKAQSGTQDGAVRAREGGPRPHIGLGMFTGGSCAGQGEGCAARVRGAAERVGFRTMS